MRRALRRKQSGGCDDWTVGHQLRADGTQREFLASRSNAVKPIWADKLFAPELKQLKKALQRSAEEAQDQAKAAALAADQACAEAAELAAAGGRSLSALQAAAAERATNLAAAESSAGRDSADPQVIAAGKSEAKAAEQAAEAAEHLAAEAAEQPKQPSSASSPPDAEAAEQSAGSAGSTAATLPAGLDTNEKKDLSDDAAAKNGDKQSDAHAEELWEQQACSRKSDYTERACLM